MRSVLFDQNCATFTSTADATEHIIDNNYSKTPGLRARSGNTRNSS